MVQVFGPRNTGGEAQYPTSGDDAQDWRKVSKQPTGSATPIASASLGFLACIHLMEW